MRRRSLVAGLVLTVAGCAAPQRAQRTSSVPLSEPHAYASLSAVAADSALVVVAVTTDAVETVAADATGESGERSTVTTLRLGSVLKGPGRPGDQIALRQSGVGAGAPQQIVAAGKRYLQYLTPFTFGDGRDLHQWSTTSLAALYEATDAAGTSFRRVSTASEATLPQDATLAAAQQSVAQG